MLTIFHVENVLIILNWCLCDFLLLKHINEVDGLHLHLSLTDVDIFFVWKIFYDFNTAFDYLLMLTYFSCAKCSYHSRLMFMWFSVTETYQWSARTSCWFFIYWCWHIFCVENILWFQYCFWLFTDVDIFFMCKMFLSFSTDVYVSFCYWNISMKCTHFMLICHLLMLTFFFYVQNVLIILNWCLCDFLVLKHIDEVDALHPHLSYTTFDYLLMLTIFHVENVLIILDWCLCDFLLLKHINEVDGPHLHLSLTDVDIFFVWKIFYDFNTAFDYLLMLTYFSCAKCSYHSRLMFLWFSVTETYQLSGWTSCMFICDLLMLTYFLCGKYSMISILLLIIYWCWHIFHVQNVLIILDWCLCDYLLLKHIYEVDGLHLHLSLTYFLCGKYFTISILLLIIYWCWHIFHVRNVLIILDWCLCDFLVLKHINTLHILHLHLSFTDVDIFSCWKCPTISILFLIIYWCWLFFLRKMFL